MTATASVRLAGSVRRSFGPGHYAPSAHALDHYRDLAQMFGAEFDASGFASGSRNTNTDLCLGMVEPLGDLADALDLVVLAHAVPDIDPAGAAALALAHRLTGEPPAFAIGDQGTATPFTALRIAAEYLRAGDAKRLLVLMVDQSTVPYRAVGQGPVPAAADVAVGLVLAADSSGAAGLAVRQLSEVGPAEAPAALVGLLAELAPPRGPDLTLVTGPGVGATPGLSRFSASHVRVPPGRPTTGLWDIEPHDDASVVVADYDQHLRYLCAAVVHGAARSHEENVR